MPGDTAPAKTRIHVLICSTRPSRIGPAIADWFATCARQQEFAEVHLVDLADFGLPVFDEPKHPRLRQYEHAHTRRWSASVQAADGFVFVTPEYNYGPPPALLNAMAYLVHEWAYKPVAFVSYGGISGGLRGVQMTKQVATTLRMLPVFEAVVVPSVNQQLSPAGTFAPTPQQEQAVAPLMNELHRTAVALRPLRG